MRVAVDTAMEPSSAFRFKSLATAAVLTLGFLVACGGSVLENNPDGGQYTEPDGAVCVDIALSSYDQSCSSTSDCVEITTGNICPGSCACGGTPVNKSGEAQYQAAISGIKLDDCPCASDGVPACVAGKCILCTFDGKTPGCSDGGSSADGGTGSDSSTGSDAAVCVDIDLSSFDLSCNKSSDCVGIDEGKVCSGECLCGGDAAINQSGLRRYNEEISGLKFAECECPAFPSPECVSGQCKLPVP
jgi:hypothetical protein